MFLVNVCKANKIGLNLHRNIEIVSEGALAPSFHILKYEQP